MLVIFSFIVCPAHAQGELVVGLKQEPSLLDPHRTVGFDMARIIYQMFDQLVTLDFDLRTVRPGLATHWEVGEDGTTYTFYLRRGVRFHTGREMTADDVVYSFERILDPATASPSRDTLPIKSVKALDDYTVQFELTDIFPPFLTLLSNAWFSVVNKESVAKWGDRFGTEFVDGTGPFKWVEWTPREQIVLERFEEYTWGPPIYENPGPAKLSRLVFKLIPDDTMLVLELETGNVDMIAPLALPPLDAKRYQEGEHPDIELFVFPQLDTEYFGLNRNGLLARHKEVRQAINYAIDRQAIVDEIYLGFGEPSVSLIAPATFGFWDGAHEIAYRYDPGKARELLDQSGWIVGRDGIREKDGQKLTIEVLSPPHQARRDTMALIQENLRQVGIGTRVQYLEIGPLLGLATSENTHDAILLRIAYADPDDLFHYYFHSRNLPVPARFGWNDPELDHYIDVGRTSLDEEERLAAYEQVQRILIEEAAWAPIFHGQGFIPVRKEVKGFKPHGQYSRLPILLDVWKE